MNILIDKVRIKNFRSLKNVEVDLKPITILVGANNAGKTTFLKALNSVLGYNKTILNKDDLFLDATGSQPEKKIIIDIRFISIDDCGNRIVSFSDKWASIFGIYIKADTAGNEFFAFRTSFEFNKEGDKYETKELFFEDWETEPTSGNSLSTTQLHKSILLHFLDAQRDLQDDIKLRTSYFGKLVTQIENDYNHADIVELKTLINKLNDEVVNKSNVLKNLTIALSDIDNINYKGGGSVSITPFPKSIRDLHKGMKVNFQNQGTDSFGMEYHGMGTRSWASILTFGAFVNWSLKQIEKKIQEGTDTNLLFPILALEEPEAHLHPNAQRTLYGQFKKFQGQKIISTHSPYIAGQAELDELRHFNKIEDTSEINYLDISVLTSDEKRKLKREVIQTQGEILFSKAILLFEGETEKQCLPLFTKRFLGKYHFECGITFICLNGNNYKPFILLSKALNIPWFIISDYDQNSVKMGVDNALKSVGYLNPDTIEYENVLKLGMPIEKYLIGLGYQNELKQGINNWYGTTVDENSSQESILIGQRRINQYNDEELLKDISSKDGKVRYPHHWATAITNLPIDRAIPQQFCILLKKISNCLAFEDNHTKIQLILSILNNISLKKDNDSTTLG